MNSLEIKKFREKYNLTQDDLSKIVKSSVSAVRSWEQGHRNIPQSIIHILEMYDEERTEYLQSQQTDDNPKVPTLQTKIISSKVQVPYYDVDFAGGWNSVELFSQHKPSFVISSPDFARAEFACNLVGNSISNRIKNGAIIGLKEVNEWWEYFPTNELYGVITKNELRTVKIVKRSKEKGYLDLIPDPLPEFNYPEYETETISMNYVLKMYQVVAWAFFERLAM